ncbi:MAG: CBS domain-containing protein [Planctomycetota bacterium]|jgi:CBS domain-containing protein
MLKAKDIMTEDVVSVKKDTPIYKALELLAKHNISGIPVVFSRCSFGKRCPILVLCT